MASGVEFGDLNWLGMGLAVVANIVIGSLWYSPKSPTGRIWMRDTGHDMSHKPTGGEMAKAMGLMLIGVLLTMFVLAHTFIAYRDAYRLDDPTYELGIADGLIGGFFVWLGFNLPIQLNSVAFDRKPWSLFTVNSLYYLVAFLVAGLLLVTVGA